jgi:dynein heavy chain
MVKPNSVNTPEALTKLWVHESQRVFADRLISVDDRTWFQNTAYELVGRCFKMGWT